MENCCENTVRPVRTLGFLGAITLIAALAGSCSSNPEPRTIPKVQTESMAYLVEENQKIPGRYYGNQDLMAELTSSDRSVAIENINKAYDQLQANYPEWLDDTEIKSLVDLWMNESRWQQDADNNNSDAYGIPQAMYSKKYINQGYFIGYKDYPKSADTQIAWGLYYITEKYNRPSAAWQYWQDHGWY